MSYTFATCPNCKAPSSSEFCFADGCRDAKSNKRVLLKRPFSTLYVTPNCKACGEPTGNRCVCLFCNTENATIRKYNETSNELYVIPHMNSTIVSQWDCSACTFFNKLSSTHCSMCGSARSDEKKRPVEKRREHVSSQWDCSACTFLNELSSTRCSMCTTSRRDEKRKPDEEKHVHHSSSDDRSGLPRADVVGNPARGRDLRAGLSRVGRGLPDSLLDDDADVVGNPARGRDLRAGLSRAGRGLPDSLLDDDADVVGNPARGRDLRAGLPRAGLSRVGRGLPDSLLDDDADVVGNPARGRDLRAGRGQDKDKENGREKDPYDIRYGPRAGRGSGFN